MYARNVALANSGESLIRSQAKYQRRMGYINLFDQALETMGTAYLLGQGEGGASPSHPSQYWQLGQ